MLFQRESPHWLIARSSFREVLAYFQRQVPETKNRTLPDIERDLDLPESHDDRRHRSPSTRPTPPPWCSRCTWRYWRPRPCACS
ncbi:MAG: hypothetical protein ACRDOI_18300 [Trebonia sp.]